MSNSQYTPDRWVVVNFTFSNGESIRKVLGGWSGGYLTGDSWRLNSGIASEEDCGEYLLFHGYSGSVYRCYKNSEGVNGITASILASWEQQAKEQNVSFEVEQYTD